MISARIESLLERAIDKRLLEPRSKRRKGIVPNLDNIIDLAHRLGILHAIHADALHALRRIRNSSAHFDEPMSLEDQRQDHVVGNRTEAAYARSDLFERRRTLMQRWADYLAAGA